MQRYTVVYVFYHLAFLTYQWWVWLSFHHEVTEGQFTNFNRFTHTVRTRSVLLSSSCVREKASVKECPRVRLGIWGKKQ